MWTLHNGFWDFALMFVFWTLIGVFAYQAIRALVEPAEGEPGRRSRADEVLDERYARGEISAEEYRERRETLREAKTPA